MAKCQTCGNDYDKTFQILVAGEAHTSIVSNAPSRRSRQHVKNAVVGFSDMAWRKTASSTAAIIAPKKMAKPNCGTEREPLCRGAAITVACSLGGSALL